MKTIKTLFAITLLAFSCGLAAAQNFDKAKLDQYFEVLEKNNKLMGSVALAQNGKLVYERAFGFANVENNIPITPATKMRIGSITKMFTAALILKAQEEGKISIKESIAPFFPEIKNATSITISQLMNHRSGIHSFTANPDYLTWNTQPKSRAELYQIILEGGSDFAPDTKAQYSNSNYVLLTWILEDVYRKPYADILDEKILKPLKLRDVEIGGKASANPDQAYSYGYKGQWVRESETDMSIPLGAGALVATPEDLTSFIEGLFSEKIISPSSLELMQEMKDNYGRGMFSIPFYDKKSYGHTGGIDEFKSMLSYFVDDKLSIAMAVNGAVIDPNQAAIAVLSAFYGKDYEIPTFKSIEDPSLLEAYAGQYASPGFPLEIAISKAGDGLTLQATGQPSIGLAYEGGNVFSFKGAGLELEFFPDSESMVLKQGGGEYKFTKKK